MFPLRIQVLLKKVPKSCVDTSGDSAASQLFCLCRSNELSFEYFIQAKADDSCSFLWGWHCSSCCGWECYYPLEPGQEHSLVCFRSDSCGKKNYGKKLKSIGIYCIKTDDVFWSFNILYSQSQSSVSLESLSSLLLHPILRNLNSLFGIHKAILIMLIWITHRR